jgi:hypothetical protein
MPAALGGRARFPANAHAPALLGCAGENFDPLDRPNRTDSCNLHARLFAGADDSESVRMRIGQELGRNPTRRACAHLSKQIGLDHRLEAAVE